MGRAEQPSRVALREIRSSDGLECLGHSSATFSDLGLVRMPHEEEPPDEPARQLLVFSRVPWRCGWTDGSRSFIWNLAEGDEVDLARCHWFFPAEGLTREDAGDVARRVETVDLATTAGRMA